MSRLRSRIAGSRIAPAAAFPLRARRVATHDMQVVRASARWLIRSREHHNYTYDLTDINREHLAWWLSDVSGKSVQGARSYLDEIEQDDELSAHVRSSNAASERRGLADRDVRYGRRIGWYALTRALRPSHVVETGTDKGLGSCVLAAALLRNGSGRLTTIDVSPDSGYLISGRYADVSTRVCGDSVAAIRDLETPVDLFLHDSLHTVQHEAAEFEAVADKLSQGAIVLSDYAHASLALPRWAERTDRRFAFFREEPLDHWYPGDGIGAAIR